MDDTTQEEKVIGAPLTPNSIPRQTSSEQGAVQKQRTIQNPLDFRPKSGIFSFIKIPGIVFIGILLAYIVGRLGWNFLFIFPIGHVVYFVFRRRVRAFSNTLEALLKEKDRKNALGEYESVEWLNYIVGKFWEVGEARVSSIIYTIVNRELKANTPKFLNSLKLTELTLGTRPPVVERIGFLNRNDDSITVECAVNFIPMQTSEDILAYFGEERKHWNTCIELTATVGAEIALVREIPFVRSLSISMLELPLIDFELHPLKTVDFMDLPYLSRTISAIINSQLKSQLLFPQLLTVDLKDVAAYKGAVIGVVYVFVGSLETADEGSAVVELGVDGREFARTTPKTGAHPAFNEGFYRIVKDTTRSIGITAHLGSVKYTGQVFLRNLNKFYYSEKVHLSSETGKKFVEVSSRFYRLCNKRTRCGIINLSLVSIRDLQAIGDPRNRVYSTYCEISMETKESVRVRQVIQRFETMRVFSTKDPFYNETFSFFVREFGEYVARIRVIDEKTATALGELVIPLDSVEDGATNCYKLGGVVSGDAEVRFSIKYVDFNDESATVEEVVQGLQLLCSVPSEMVGEAAPVEKAVEKRGVTRRRKHRREEDTGIPGAFIDCAGQSGIVRRRAKRNKHSKIASPSLGIYTRKKIGCKFVEFKKVYKIKIVKISEPGSFYIVFETDSCNIKMEPFSTDIKITREVLVPITHEDVIRARLFRMHSAGDAFVSEELFDLSSTVVVFNTIRVELASEVAPLRYCEAPDDSENAKFIQFRLDNFSEPDEYLISVSSNGHLQTAKAPHLGLLCLGEGGVDCTIRRGSTGVARIPLPVRSGSEVLQLSKELDCLFSCFVQTCDFKMPSGLGSGSLEIYIIKANNVHPIVGATSNPYVKVYLNGEKIYRTARKSNTNSPIFNENLKIKINQLTDTLGFHLAEYSAIAATSIIAYKEISLLNIPRGYTRVDLPLAQDGISTADETILQVIFHFYETGGAD